MIGLRFFSIYVGHAPLLRMWGPKFFFFLVSISDVLNIDKYSEAALLVKQSPLPPSFSAPPPPCPSSPPPQFCLFPSLCECVPSVSNLSIRKRKAKLVPQDRQDGNKGAGKAGGVNVTFQLHFNFPAHFMSSLLIFHHEGAGPDGEITVLIFFTLQASSIMEMAFLSQLPSPLPHPPSALSPDLLAPCLCPHASWAPPV